MHWKTFWPRSDAVSGFATYCRRKSCLAPLLTFYSTFMGILGGVAITIGVGLSTLAHPSPAIVKRTT